MKKKVLFVSHEATLNGAPLVGYRIATYLSIHYRLACIYLSNGPLLKVKDHPFVIINFYNNEKTLLGKIISRIFNRKNVYRKQIESFRPDIIILNSIVSISFLDDVKSESYKKVIYLHETPLAIVNYLQLNNFSTKCLRQFDLIIVVNDMIKQFLIKDLNIPQEQISVIEPCIDDQFYLNINSQLHEMNYDIILSGYGGWTKGTDLVPQLLNELSVIATNKNLKLGWIGSVDIQTQNQINYDIKMLGVSHKLEFIGIQYDVQPILNSSKIFVSLSRSDAFPTACLEALAMGKPVIYFKNSGGLAVLLEQEFCYDIDYLDLKKMAERINFILENKEVYNWYSSKAVSIASSFSIEKKGKEIFDKINALI